MIEEYSWPEAGWLNDYVMFFVSSRKQWKFLLFGLQSRIFVLLLLGSFGHFKDIFSGWSKKNSIRHWVHILRVFWYNLFFIEKRPYRHTALLLYIENAVQFIGVTSEMRTTAMVILKSQRIWFIVFPVGEVFSTCFVLHCPTDSETTPSISKCLIPLIF